MAFDDLFWLSLLIIFGASIMTALFRSRQRDKCLRLMDDHHVTLLGEDGDLRWGDLIVFAGGMELIFDEPYETRRGLKKSSVLLFSDDIARCVAVCRTVHALTDKEQQDRKKQIERSFRPGIIRRTMRRARNFLNTIGDAIRQSVGVVAASIGRGHALGTALTAQKATIDQVSGTIVGQVANKYEPMLERHIGRPVVLDLPIPGGGSIELPGFLVDYTDKYVAVFNVAHTPLAKETLEATQDTETPYLTVAFAEDHVTVRSRGDDPIIITKANGRDLSVVLLPGAQLILRPEETIVLELERVRALDIVCPRARARVRFGSGDAPTRKGWLGLPPLFS